MLHVVELACVAPQSWRNGGGVTRELLAWPAGAGADWQLRVSVAEIEQDGPFSPFPGVQRCFAVLEGAGVVLGFPHGDQALTPASAPLAFDGGEAPGCRLLAGPTRDLNLMARHTAGQLLMRPASAGEQAPAGMRWCGLYAATAVALTAPGAAPVTVPAHALAWSDGPAVRWSLAESPGKRAWWLALEAAA